MTVHVTDARIASVRRRKMPGSSVATTDGMVRASPARNRSIGNGVTMRNDGSDVTVTVRSRMSIAEVLRSSITPRTGTPFWWNAMFSRGTTSSVTVTSGIAPPGLSVTDPRASPEIIAASSHMHPTLNPSRRGDAPKPGR